MHELTFDEVLSLHDRIIAQSGGSDGVRDRNAIESAESALAQPWMAFGGQDPYPSLAEKAAALEFSLINNHPFVDGNKRIGHSAMEVFLVRNGHVIDAPVDEQERVVLAVAAGEMAREEWTQWVQSHLQEWKP